MDYGGNGVWVPFCANAPVHCPLAFRFFQIRDDLLDLISKEFAKKKGGYGSDFKEGKFSFPVIHCVRYSALHHLTPLLICSPIYARRGGMAAGYQRRQHN